MTKSGSYKLEDEGGKLPHVALEKADIYLHRSGSKMQKGVKPDYGVRTSKIHLLCRQWLISHHSVTGNGVVIQAWVLYFSKNTMRLVLEAVVPQAPKDPSSSPGHG